MSSVHGGIVAPPTMLQTWILEGFGMATPSPAPRDKQQELHALFDAQGYTGVVATNCDQGYDRYLRPGDQVSATTVIETISPEKATAIGIGYFIETRTTFLDQHGERVGWMVFRVLKFKPVKQPQPPAEGDAAPAAPVRLRPPRAHDNGWWWDKIDAGELHVQKCSDCGALRHPPRPMCGQCQSLEWGSVVACGRGSVHSYVIMHHPPIPGYGFPIAVGLIDLAEGTRIVSNVVGCDLEDVHIGMEVRLSIENVDDETKLPLFRPAG
ncbi:MAG: bifunctional MaoC family dehydratase N-terminal/OB-fold nucleic acid binding domain-containing protein [Myxococcota bacterium]